MVMVDVIGHLKFITHLFLLPSFNFIINFWIRIFKNIAKSAMRFRKVSANLFCLKRHQVPLGDASHVFSKGTQHTGRSGRTSRNKVSYSNTGAGKKKSTTNNNTQQRTAKIKWELEWNKETSSLFNRTELCEPPPLLPASIVDQSYSFNIFFLNLTSTIK